MTEPVWEKQEGWFFAENWKTRIILGLVDFTVRIWIENDHWYGSVCLGVPQKGILAHPHIQERLYAMEANRAKREILRSVQWRLDEESTEFRQWWMEKYS